MDPLEIVVNVGLTFSTKQAALVGKPHTYDSVEKKVGGLYVYI